jgi:hypothetical protein
VRRLAVLVGLLTALLAGCADSSAGRGAVPIPYPTPAAPVVATPGRPAVLSMGDTVAAGDTQVTASGPDLPTPPQGAPPPESAPGTLTVTARGGAPDLATTAFVLRDELGHPVPFTLTPAGPGTVRLAATMAAGQTVLEWDPHGTPTATWDFQVELD